MCVVGVAAAAGISALRVLTNKQLREGVDALVTEVGVMQRAKAAGSRH